MAAMTSRPSVRIAAALGGLCLCATTLAQPPEGYVAVISVDGLGASELFSQPTCLPARSAIRELARNGTYSRGVRPVFPAITYPSHATMVTGVNPDRHGVIDNGVRGQWFAKRADIAVETLWDAARKAGKSVAIVTWPSTYGATADYLVPEDLSNHAIATEQIREGSSPGLFDALVSAVKLPQLLPFSHPEAGLPLDTMTARFAAEVVRRHKPRLLLTHFLDYDHRMHAMPYSPDACKALARIDEWIAQLVDAYRAAGILERTTFFVVSDHGFLEVKAVVSLFALLKDAGWDELFPGEDVAKAFDLKVAGGSAAFYPTASRDPQWTRRIHEELRPRIVQKHGRAVAWVSPDQARFWGGFPGAIFSLCARPGYSFGVRPPSMPQVLWDPGNVRGMHGYCPDQPAMEGAFIASGYRIRAGGPAGRMAMVDVAPTIAAFLPARMGAVVGRDRSPWFRTLRRRAPS